MKLLKQFTIILGISFLGEILNTILPFPIPASVYGLGIMFFLLLSGLLQLEQVKSAADFLIEIMPVMFVPAAVGLLDSAELLLPVLFPLLAVIILSTILVMAVSGSITQWVIRIRRKGRE